MLAASGWPQGGCATVTLARMAMLAMPGSAVLVALVLAARWLSAQEPPGVYCGGEIVRDTLVRTGTSYHFEMYDPWGTCPAGTPHVKAVYDGELPGAVCDDADVALLGRVAGDHFEARRVIPWRRFRYDGGCWRWRCLPPRLRPSACQPRFL